MHIGKKKWFVMKTQKDTFSYSAYTFSQPACCHPCLWTRSVRLSVHTFCTGKRYYVMFFFCEYEGKCLWALSCLLKTCLGKSLLRPGVIATFAIFSIYISCETLIAVQYLEKMTHQRNHSGNEWWNDLWCKTLWMLLSDIDLITSGCQQSS